MKSATVTVQQIAIGSLFNYLATYETQKGKVKALEDDNKAIRSLFVIKADSQDADFLSESGQKCASLRIQTRATLSREMLLAAGVSAETLDACSVQASFPVLRVH